MSVEAVTGILGWVLKLGLFQKYRTKIGATAIALSVAIPAVLSPEMMEAWPALADAPKWLLGIGAYFASIGARYKDD